jgi:hypothetical protein
VEQIKPFLATHEHFLVYESWARLNFVPEKTFLDAGYKLKSAHTDSGGTLYEFER